MTNNGKEELRRERNDRSQQERSESESIHLRFESFREQVRNYSWKKKLVSGQGETREGDFDVEREHTSSKSQGSPSKLLVSHYHTSQVKEKTNPMSVGKTRRAIERKPLPLLLVSVFAVVALGGFFSYRFFSTKTKASEKVIVKALPVFAKDPLLSQNLSTLFNTLKAIAISEKNTLAITDGKEVKIVDLNNSNVVTTFTYKSGGEIAHLAFSQDGHILLTGDNRGSIQVWQLGGANPSYTLNKHSPLAIKSLALASDNNTLVSADIAGNIFAWDLASKESKALFGHSAAVNSLAVSSDLGIIVSGGNDNTVRLWDLKSGKQLFFLTDRHAVFSVAISPDGKTVYSGNGRGVIHAWDTTTKKLLQTFSRQKEKISNLGIVGSALIGTSNDGTVMLFNRTKSNEYSQLAERHNLYVNFLAIRPDMGLIITGDPKHIKAWKLRTK